MRRTASALMVLLAAACTGGPPRQPHTAIERALARAPGAAQPVTIVATEAALARTAREDGQWTAFRAYAAPGAVMEGPTGIFAAEPWLAAQADPSEAVTWAPRSVWMSCDGALAVSQGRYRHPAGNVGTFVTLWQRQKDGDYRWLYHGGADNVPQPSRPVAGRATPDDAIVVTANDSIRGLVADCPAKTVAPPEPPSALSALRAGAAGRTSPDGTLSVHWTTDAAGTRSLTAWWLADGRWQRAMDVAWAPGKPG